MEDGRLQIRLVVWAEIFENPTGTDYTLSMGVGTSVIAEFAGDLNTCRSISIPARIRLGGN